MSPPSITLMPDQVAALNGLIRETEAFAVDVAEDTYRSLRVVTFAPNATDDDGEDTTPVVRYWTVSVAGTIREHSALTDVAA